MLVEPVRPNSMDLPDDPVPASRPPAASGAVADALHILVLVNFAVAQPVYGRLARHTVYLLDEQIAAHTLVLLVLILSVLVPAGLIALEFAAGRFGSAARRRLHGVLVYSLSMLILLAIVDRFERLPWIISFTTAGFMSGLILFAYRSFAIARAIVSAAAIGVVVFPAAFLLASPAKHLVFAPIVDVEPARKADVVVHRPAPIVVLVLDEFCGMSLLDRHKGIDASRYPNFAALARQGTWYRNASAVHSRTVQAVPAILTGRYPRGEREPTLSEYPVNLFTLLRATGCYDPVVFEPVTRLFPLEWDEPGRAPPSPMAKQLRALANDLGIVYLHSLTLSRVPFVTLPSIPLEWLSLGDRRARRSKRAGLVSYTWDAERRTQFEHFLDCVRASERPRLYFQHLCLPHYDWCYLPTGQAYRADQGRSFQPDGIDGTYEVWHDDDFAIAQAYQRYLLQVGFVDHLLGQLLDRLRGEGIFDSCLLIVTADHGLSFRRDALRREPDAKNLPDLMSVPLFIKLPNQQVGAVSDENVEIVDILPTIADTIGLDLPLETDGQSLVAPTRRPRPEKTLVTDRGVITVRGTFDDRYQVADRMHELFGSGDSWAGVFKIGPRPELIGRRPNEFPVAPRTGLPISLLRQAGAPYRNQVHCRFDGRIDSYELPNPPVELAIALNGVIRTVTRPFLWAGKETDWVAMVPPTSLRPGANEIEIYAVTPSGGSIALDRLLHETIHSSQR